MSDSASRRDDVASHSLRHLDRLSCEVGIYEHALFADPRPEHGCCTDDNARLLVVMAREPDDGVSGRLGRLALDFVMNAQVDSGLVHNRYLNDGHWRWVDAPGLGDQWGRALWALGAAAAGHPNAGVRAKALWGFDRSARQRSPWLRSMAFAALGAADVLLDRPAHSLARSLLVDAAIALLPGGDNTRVWPEDRLTYANAALAEALIAAGAALDADGVTGRGLAMLEWLLDAQMRDGHLSVVGTEGRDLDDRRVQFDQQPIEVAALADACWRAWTVTGDPRWQSPIITAFEWFLGNNDAGMVMVDERSGGAYDGLQEGGRNLNEGAESTLAMVSTMQRAAAVSAQMFDSRTVSLQASSP